MVNSLNVIMFSKILSHIIGIYSLKINKFHFFIHHFISIFFIIFIPLFLNICLFAPSFNSLILPPRLLIFFRLQNNFFLVVQYEMNLHLLMAWNKFVLKLIFYAKWNKNIHRNHSFFLRISHRIAVKRVAAKYKIPLTCFLNLFIVSAPEES